MRVLLIQIPTSHLGAGERVYPLGLSRLAGLAPPGLACRGLDMNLHADPWPMLRHTIEDFQPQWVVLSFRNLDPLAGQHVSYLSSLKTTARLVRRLSPGSRIIAGGPAFTLFAERLMAETEEIDIGVPGEGETALAILFSSPARINNVPGAIHRRGNALVRNPPGPLTAMDALPSLATHIFAPESYLCGNAYVAAMGIEGKRGCDLRCAYCVYPMLGGGSMRLRPPGQIVDEMERLYKEHRASLFHFTDGVLNRPTDHFEAVCRQIKTRGITVAWTGFFREDTLSARQLALACEAGLAAVYFSADALNDRGLALLNKHLTTSHLLKAARITADNGILTMCHFMVNLPGEDKAQAEDNRRTLDRLLNIHHKAGNLGAVIFNNVRLYPGAALTRRLTASDFFEISCGNQFARARDVFISATFWL